MYSKIKIKKKNNSLGEEKDKRNRIKEES